MAFLLVLETFYSTWLVIVPVLSMRTHCPLNFTLADPSEKEFASSNCGWIIILPSSSMNPHFLPTFIAASPSEKGVFPFEGEEITILLS